MPLKLTLKDGSQVESDSVYDLLEFYEKVSALNGRGDASTTSKKHASNVKDLDLKEAPRKLLNMLFVAAEPVDTGNVAKSFGVTPRGIGGTITSLTKWGKQHGLSKKQMLVRGRRSNGNGHNVRTLALAENFRKMIKEGKVPGLKLDT